VHLLPNGRDGAPGRAVTRRDEPMGDLPSRTLS